MRTRLTILVAVASCFLCSDPQQAVSPQGPSDDAATVVVYLPQIPASFAKQVALTGARLELLISGSGMPTIEHTWRVGAIPTDPVAISGIPAGTARRFTGRLFNAANILTHQGQVVTGISAGDTVDITLKLSVQTGTARVCIEVEGLPSSCNSDDTDDTASLPAGLVAYYPLDGNALDMSGGQDGVVHNAVACTNRFGQPGKQHSLCRVSSDNTWHCRS